MTRVKGCTVARSGSPLPCSQVASVLGQERLRTSYIYTLAM